jgi:hypothetical protein
LLDIEDQYRDAWIGGKSEKKQVAQASTKSEARNPKQARRFEREMFKTAFAAFGIFRTLNLFRISNFVLRILLAQRLPKLRANPIISAAAAAARSPVGKLMPIDITPTAAFPDRSAEAPLR